MADRYLVSLSGKTWNGTNTNLWATSSGGTAGASAPTSSDNVIWDSNSGSGTLTIASGAACANLTIGNTAVKTDVISLSANFSPSGNVSITGNAAINRILIVSSIIGTARTITVNGTLYVNNVDFRDITGAGSASWDLSGTSTGDCQGNSGITFTAPTTCYWKHGTTNASQNWSGTTTTDGNRWFQSDYTTQSRVPLPQDDVVFGSGSFSATGKTVNQDMPRMARNIDWTGATNSPTWKLNTTTQDIYGSLTLIENMSITRGSNLHLYFANRSSVNLTCAANTNKTNLLPNIWLNSIGSSVVLQDTLYLENPSTPGISYGLQLLYGGTFDCNNNDIYVAQVKASTTGTRGIINSKDWYVSGRGTTTSAPIFFSIPTGLTIDPPDNLYMTNTESVGAGAEITSLGIVWNNIIISGTGNTITSFVDACSFANMTVSGISTKTVKFKNGVNHTISGTQFLRGTSSGNITVTSTSGTSAFTLIKNSGLPVRTDYITLSYSTFSSSGGVKGYAGIHSTNAGTVTGWIFDSGSSGNAIIFGDSF